MVQCELGQAGLYAAIAIWLPPYAWLLVLVALATLFSRTFAAASKSTIPALVGRDDLLSANALMNTVFNLQVALGPAFGGLLVAVSGGSRWGTALGAPPVLGSRGVLLPPPRRPRAASGPLPARPAAPPPHGGAGTWRPPPP